MKLWPFSLYTNNHFTFNVRFFTFFSEKICGRHYFDVDMTLQREIAAPSVRPTEIASWLSLENQHEHNDFTRAIENAKHVQLDSEIKKYHNWNISNR